MLITERVAKEVGIDQEMVWKSIKKGLLAGENGTKKI